MLFTLPQYEVESLSGTAVRNVINALSAVVLTLCAIFKVVSKTWLIKYKKFNLILVLVVGSAYV